MKLRRSFLPRRAVSLLVSTALCTSLLALPAHAAVYTTNPDDSFQFDRKTQTFAQETKSTLQTELERIGAIEDTRENYNERYQAYLSLCEQYPDIPVLRLKLAECMRSYEKDKSKVLQELETAIQLAETYQNWEDEDLVDYLDLDFSFGVFTSFSEAHSFTKDTFLRAAYGMEAGIYLDFLYQQENYIAAMRRSLQFEEASLRKSFSDDILVQIYGIDDGDIVLNMGADIMEIMDAVSRWPYVTRELRAIKAKQKELDRIEEWYRSGSPVNFSAWDGRVTVDHSYRAGCTTVSVQNPTSGYITSDTYELMYRQSPAQVLRGLEGVYLHWPTGTDYDGITETKIYADGSKKESKNTWSSATVGYAFEFSSLQELELPDTVLQYLEATYSESPNDGVYHEDISYIVYTF